MNRKLRFRFYAIGLTVIPFILYLLTTTETHQFRNLLQFHTHKSPVHTEFSTQSDVIIETTDENQGGFYFEQCNCLKYKTRIRNTSSTELDESLCSEEGDWIGLGQRVLSFTLHENLKPTSLNDDFEYFVEGIGKNLREIRARYPGWIMRLYTDHQLNAELCKFACMDDFMWCNVRQSRFGNMMSVDHRVWRFLVIGDPTVDIFLCRDLDSRISDRELEVVEQWLSLPFTFHCGRDSSIHPASMWAGNWGAKNHQLYPNVSVMLRKEFIRQATNVTRYGLDEELLLTLIYRRFSTDILCHDAYQCEMERHNAVKCVPFPKQRKNRAERLAQNYRDIEIAPPCPAACRPTYGKNWTYC